MMSPTTTIAEMISTASSMTIPTLHKQTSSIVAKQQQQQLPIAIPSHSSFPNRIPKKPMRPLTAYHIFFQIEREYVIQTSAGEVADKSMMDNKITLEDVPERYKNIKLLPDWYAGPGKRQKRKHRKQHGKIGFLELSRVISTRWAKLDEIDPETKAFVTKIAKSEVEEYYREMKEYKELTKNMNLPAPSKKTSKKRMMQLTPRPDMVSSYNHQGNNNNSFMPPISAQLSQDIDYFLSCVANNNTQDMLPSNFSTNNNNNMIPSSSSMPPTFSFEQQEQQQVLKKRKMFHNGGQEEDQNAAMPIKNFSRQDSAIYKSFNSFMNEGDNSIDNNFDDLLCQPINTSPVKRTVSYGSSQCNNDALSIESPSSVEVDICDDEILQLWNASCWSLKIRMMHT